VSEDDKQAFQSILEKLRFVRGISPNEKWFPGIYHYYGYDDDSQKIIHVHLHYKLIVGYDMLKNYHLPLEKELLENLVEQDRIFIPIPEMEYIFFVIRMVLKRRLLPLLLGNPIKSLAVLVGGGRDPLSGSAKNEYDDLKEKVDPGKLQECLKKYFSFIKCELWKVCDSSIDPQCSKFAWYLAGRQLIRALKPFRRHPQCCGGFLALARVIKNKVGVLLSKAGVPIWRKKRFQYGGKLIALVGGDGSGKTTNLENLSKFFSRTFDVRMMHMGKPPKGFLLYSLILMTRVVKKTTRSDGGRFLNALVAWRTAQRRLKAFQKAKKMRSKGILVLADRFPLPFLKVMDSPRVRIETGAKGLYAVLAKWEESYYKKIRGADQIIVMKVSPQVAARRRQEGAQANLSERVQEIWDINWPPFYAAVIDAEQELGQVNQQVIKAAWSVLGKKPIIAELIGPAGAGKSTIAAQLPQQCNDIQTAVSSKEFKFILFLTIVRLLPKTILLLCQGVAFKYLRVAVGVEAILPVLKKHNERHILDCRCLVYDGGPILRLACLQMWGVPELKNRYMNEWLESLHIRTRNLYNEIYWLDASDDFLVNRINNRKKEHRVKEMDPNELIPFFERYRKSFELVFKHEDEQRVHEVKCDTQKLDINQTVELILAILN
jgi:thymidylate kinase